MPSPNQLSTNLWMRRRYACQKIAQAGITSIHWILISQGELAIVQKARRRRETSHSESTLSFPYEFLKETDGFKPKDPSMVHVGGVFITTDGYLDSKTAALSQPYSDDPSNSGKMLLTKQELASSVAQGFRNGSSTRDTCHGRQGN